MILIHFPKNLPCAFDNLPYKATLSLTHLFNPEDPRPSPLPRLNLLLVPLFKSNRILVRSAQVIKILDLVNSNDPVLTGECLLESGELGSLGGDLASSHTVGGLTGGEEGVVVVVAHLVHERVAHGWRCLVVDAVLATRGEVVALLDLVGPDA